MKMREDTLARLKKLQSYNECRFLAFRDENYLAEAILYLLEQVEQLKSELEEVKSGKQGLTLKEPLVLLIEELSELLEWRTAGELLEVFSKTAKDKGIEFCYTNPRAIGNKLQSSWDLLSKFFLCEKKVGNGNIRRYKFSRKI